MSLQGIMVVVLIISDWIFVLMDTTNMILCRQKQHWYILKEQKLIGGLVYLRSVATKCPTECAQHIPLLKWNNDWSLSYYCRGYSKVKNLIHLHSWGCYQELCQVFHLNPILGKHSTIKTEKHEVRVLSCCVPTPSILHRHYLGSSHNLPSPINVCWNQGFFT